MERKSSATWPGWWNASTEVREYAAGILVNQDAKRLSVNDHTPFAGPNWRQLESAKAPANALQFRPQILVICTRAALPR